jgi:hypothetical protein
MRAAPGPSLGRPKPAVIGLGRTAIRRCTQRGHRQRSRACLTLGGEGAQQRPNVATTHGTTEYCIVLDPLTHRLFELLPGSQHGGWCVAPPDARTSPFAPGTCAVDGVAPRARGQTVSLAASHDRERAQWRGQAATGPPLSGYRKGARAAPERAAYGCVVASHVGG